jgi:hypothetical protein
MKQILRLTLVILALASGMNLYAQGATGKLIIGTDTLGLERQYKLKVLEMGGKYFDSRAGYRLCGQSYSYQLCE